MSATVTHPGAGNDARAAIQAAIDGAESEIILPYTGDDWLVTSTINDPGDTALDFAITMKDGKTLTLEPGVVLKTMSNYFHSTKSCLIGGNYPLDTAVIQGGEGSRIVMNAADYLTGDYVASEFRMAIYMTGVTGLTIQNVSVEDSGGDGLYLGLSTISPTNVTVSNCTFKGHYRNQATIEAGDGVTFDKCYFVNTMASGSGGTSPWAGIDIEPSYAGSELTNILINRCGASHMRGAGFLVSFPDAPNLNTTDAVSISFVDCESSNEGNTGAAPGFRIQMGDTSPAAASAITLTNCRARGQQQAGIGIGQSGTPWSLAATCALTFNQCSVSQCGLAAGVIHPIDLTLTGTSTGSAITFTDCSVEDHLSRTAISFSSATENPVDGVSGTVRLYRESVNGGASQVQTNLPNVTVTDYYRACRKARRRRYAYA